MLILAIESAAAGCSVSVWQDGIILASYMDTMTHKQSEILLPMIIRVLEGLGKTFRSVDLFAVTVGPGSFTGVRIALSTAKSLSLAVGCPLVGITTTETIAWSIQNPNTRIALVLLNTYRSDIYVQPFLLTSICPIPLWPTRSIEPTTVSDLLSNLPLSCVVVGNCASHMPLNIVHEIRELQPHAAIVATIAATRKNTSIVALEPLYLSV